MQQSWLELKAKEAPSSNAGTAQRASGLHKRTSATAAPARQRNGNIMQPLGMAARMVSLSAKEKYKSDNKCMGLVSA